MSLLPSSSNVKQFVYLAQQIREHEGNAAKASGCDLFTLMERAGHAAFLNWKSFNAQQTLVLVGSGNNAGDGYIAASLIKQADRHVVVCAVDENKELTGDAAKAQKRWIDAGGEICNFSADALDECDVIIDALLGTGLENTVRDNVATIIKAANESTKPILSIDVPSGINADTGQPLGIAIKATKTITFVGVKQGLTTAAGKQYVGELIFDDLAIGESFVELASPSGKLININSFKGLGPRALNSHKGSYGKLLCIGGNQGTAGAISLTSEAALRAGAGMVRVHTHESSIMPVSFGRPELMVSSNNLQHALEWASCAVIGPGLGQDEWAKNNFNQVIEYCTRNNMLLVIDADALNLLAKQASPKMPTRCVLTPHPGEASRLLKVTTGEIESDRFSYVQQCAKRYSAVCVLKGAGTLIADGKHTWVCEEGSPALAVGGSGDVLTGIVGALLAQGLDCAEATCYGVTLHAKAGDIAGQKNGERGMLPSDLFCIVRRLINNIKP